jgi:hypothetical protein
MRVYRKQTTKRRSISAEQGNAPQHEPRKAKRMESVKRRQRNEAPNIGYDKRTKRQEDPAEQDANGGSKKAIRKTTDGEAKRANGDNRKQKTTSAEYDKSVSEPHQRGPTGTDIGV